MGTRFVQMVSKNARMGNLVGVGVYRLLNPFKFTERVWREAKSWGYTNGKNVSVWEFWTTFQEKLTRTDFDVSMTSCHHYQENEENLHK